MISRRTWHGWTTPQNADKYEELLKKEIFIGIQSRHIRGFKDIQLLRCQTDGEVEFITIMRFDSHEALHEFAGEDYERAVVPEKARALRSHFDERSQHYEIREEGKGDVFPFLIGGFLPAGIFIIVAALSPGSLALSAGHS